VKYVAAGSLEEEGFIVLLRRTFHLDRVVQELSSRCPPMCFARPTYSLEFSDILCKHIRFHTCTSLTVRQFGVFFSSKSAVFLSVSI
jgi:hypothetical protein